MLQTLKKYWFVCLVGVLLIGASIYFAYDQNKGKLPGKSVGGEDVVFSIGDQDITAGEFYDTLFNEMGVALSLIHISPEFLHNCGLTGPGFERRSDRPA